MNAMSAKHLVVALAAQLSLVIGTRGMKAASRPKGQSCSLRVSWPERGPPIW